MRKLLVLLSMVSLFASAMAQNAILPADVNRDGYAGVEDAAAIYSYILGTAEEGFALEQVDVNGDGLVNTADVVEVYAMMKDIAASQPVIAAVDLGLPSGLKWATCNVGATAPQGYGGYYAWGEVKTKDEYTPATAIYYQKHIGDNISATSRDVAQAEWGAPWRMPTKAEQEELCRECSWERALLNGVDGYKVTGPNGNAIFLPAAGYKYGTNVYYEGLNGYYWSSTIYCIQNSYFLYFDATYQGMFYYARFDGLTVRPVCE